MRTSLWTGTRASISCGPSSPNSRGPFLDGKLPTCHHINTVDLMLFTTHTPECQRPPLGGPAVCPCQPGGVSASWYVSCKATAEFVAALVLLVLTLPFLLLAALLVKLTSRGP